MELIKLADGELLAGLSQLVKTEKETTFKILEHLAEVDRRMLWAKKGYSSLWDFCIRHLKYSEGETARRTQGCRTLSRFEEVKPLLQNQELSLTNLCLLSPHLTEKNVSVLLDEVKGQPTRKVEEIICREFPDKKKKDRVLVLELDDEFEALLEKAKRQVSEKIPALVLKRALKVFLSPKKNRKSTVKKHTHYIPKAIQREVKNESDEMCSYVGPEGVRCNQRYHLQFDHIQPYAMGGSSLDKRNIRLLCKLHNLMRAREDFPGKVPSRARSNPSFETQKTGARL